MAGDRKKGEQAWPERSGDALYAAGASDPSLYINSPSRSVTGPVLPRLMLPAVSLAGCHTYDAHHPQAPCPELLHGPLCPFEVRTSTNIGSN